MSNEKTINVLRLTAKTLQTGYESPEKASIAIRNLLEEVDKLHIELTTNPLVRRGMMSTMELMLGTATHILPKNYLSKGKIKS